MYDKFEQRTATQHNIMHGITYPTLMGNPYSNPYQYQYLLAHHIIILHAMMIALHLY